MAQAEQKLTTIEVLERKARGPKLTMLTAYDFAVAGLLDRAGIDILLVGDSLGMVVLGQPDTLGVTLEMMVHHVRAVARGRRRALVVADMPFLSYQVSLEQAILNAGELVRAGAEAVKLEGGRRRAPVVEALCNAEIPVMGHIGLTPQSVLRLGGFKVQGREERAARALLDDARALEAAGAFALVLECVPEEVAGAISGSVAIPTIGIGAGAHCDGQVLVVNDLLGLHSSVKPPRFVRRYADLDKEIETAARRFADDVRQGSFPGASEAYHMNPGEASALKE